MSPREQPYLVGESCFETLFFSDLLSDGKKKILLNLAEVNYIDSSGLGHLVSAFTTARKHPGELKLLKLTNKVHDLMQITKLYTVFDIRDDEALAVQSFDLSSVVAEPYPGISLDTNSTAA